MRSRASLAYAALMPTLFVALVGLASLVSIEYLASFPVLSFLQSVRLVSPSWLEAHPGFVGLVCIASAIPVGLWFGRKFYRRAANAEVAVDRGEL